MSSKCFTTKDGRELSVSISRQFEHSVCWGDVTITLTPAKFAIFAMLLEWSPYVVPRPMLREVALNRHFDPHTNVVQVHVTQLRRSLNEAIPDSGWLIQTIRGRGGYKLSDAHVITPSNWTPIHINSLFRKLQAGTISDEQLKNVFGDMSQAELDMWTHQYELYGKNGLMIKQYDTRRPLHRLR